MERKCIKSVGLDKEDYEETSKNIIEDLKRIREMILKAEESSDQWKLLFDLLMAIDSMLGNKEFFRMSLSLAISASEEYLTITYYENPVLYRRMYDDTELLPTYCIIKKDLKGFYFVREKDVLPNPEHRGRQIDYEISAYSYEDNKVSLKTFNRTGFAFQVNNDCLDAPEEFVAKLQKMPDNN